MYGIMQLPRNTKWRKRLVILEMIRENSGNFNYFDQFGIEDDNRAENWASFYGTEKPCKEEKKISVEKLST